MSDVARERHLEPAKVRQLIDSVPFNSEKARQETPGRPLGYRADALDEVTTRAGKSRTLVTLSDYANDPARPKPRGDTVALVRITGAIMSGSPSRGPLDDDNIATAEDVVDALDQAARPRRSRRSCCASIRRAAPIPRPTPSPTPSGAPARPASR